MVDVRAEVRELLSSRRARISPEDAGLPAYGGNRRVAGLRREEVAMLTEPGSVMTAYTARAGSPISDVPKLLASEVADQKSLQMDVADAESTPRPH
jgi:hypothetical protein